MKKLYLLLIFVILILIGLFAFFRFGGEDSWIKDSRGIWIKHGNPSKIPDYVKEQQEAISCADKLFRNLLISNQIISSQCLGSCGDYAIDIVHVPRNSEDNLVENQCSDYREGKVTHFIELDKEGNIVRIV